MVLVAIASFFMIISSVSACTNPAICAQDAKVCSKDYSISALGGIFTIDGSKYPGSTMLYNFTVINPNDDQGMLVTLVPDKNIVNYFYGGSVYLNPGESKVLPVEVWIGGLSKTGAVLVNFACDHDPTFWTPFMYATITGKGGSPPLNNCTSPASLNGCYSDGLYKTFTCSNSNGTLIESTCVDSCCKKFGGADAMCSPDRKLCLSFDNLPPGKEGNIAFVCRDDNCKYGNERSVMFLLKLKGWNVTGKGYKSWSEDDLNKYDIIACSDQLKACKIDFNSPVYNQHIDKGKPFLEITDKNSAKAANSFGYVNRYGGTYEKVSPFVVHEDNITQGFSGTVNAIKAGKNSVTGINSKYFLPEVKSILDIAKNSPTTITTLFKVNSSQTHGRYAFIGWFSRSSVADLTTDGEKILNNTLKWLKYGYGEPVYTKAGEIAFVCNKGSCNKKTEMNLIKWLRENGYGVTGKSSWSAEELQNFNLMVCSDKKSCSFDTSSPLYTAFQNGKGFLEFPDSSYVKVGNIFGYISNKCSRQSASTVNLAQDPITEGFGNSIQVFNKKRSVCGIKEANINDDAKGISKIKDYYNIVRSTDEKRYAFIGWINYINDLTENGKELLLRTIRWAMQKL